MEFLDLMLNKYVAISGAILMACFGAYLVYRNNAINRYAAASAKFRSSLLNIFTGLYPLPDNWPSNGVAIDGMLREIFPKLQSSVAEFRPHISFLRRKAFDRAWLNYRCSTKRKIDIQCYHHYMAIDGQPDPKITFKRNVDKLISFAKEP